MSSNYDTAKVLLVSGDDWQGLYVNGLLVDERHSIPAFVVGEALEGLFVESFETREVSGEWLEEQLSLPLDFEDVPESAWL